MIFWPRETATLLKSHLRYFHLEKGTFEKFDSPLKLRIVFYTHKTIKNRRKNFRVIYTLTGFIITITAVERRLYMSRRSLLTVHRVVIFYITYALFLIPLVVGISTTWFLWPAVFIKLMHCYVSCAAFCIFVTAFAYFKVFQIIHHHQKQVQTNESAFDMRKYRQSICTILLILAIFVLSYLPFLCWQFAANILHNSESLYIESVKNVCMALVFSSSLINPLLYCWRIKETRDSVRSIRRKIFCKQNVEES